MMERIWYTCVFLALITAQYIVYCCNDNVRVLNDLAFRSSETQSNFWSGGNDIVINDADLVSGWYSATLNGWQYLMTDVSNKPYYLRCSTYWPIYLKDNHTSIDDLTEEPVDVTACVRDDINPCSTRYTIQIRKCIGEIQYKLKPSEWFSAYCFEKHTLLNRSTPSPAPENVDFGRITVKPELEFKSILLGPVMTQNIPYLNFRCLFNKRNDLFYTVQWYIDETALDKTMGPSKDMADLVLNEDDLSSRNITMGIYVRCGVRASISENGMLTPMNRSEKFYAGIKISQTNVYLDKGSSAVVQMLSTVPIGCKYFKGTNTSLVCKAEMKLFVDDGDPLQCEKGSILNKVDEDDDNGNEVVNQHCAQYIKTLAKEDTWDPSYKFNFTIVTSDINYDDKRKFILKLQFGKTMSQTIWKDYFFPEVEVFVQNTDTYQQKVCKSRNDPHMTTGDGYRYENHVTGTYMLYFNKEYNIEVQQTIKQCDYGWEIAKCTCAVGIKAGQDVFMINRCGSPTLFAFTQCGDGGILDVQRVNDLLYRVFTPIGTRVSI
ncbi:von Willebrand factor D and EGF domain-containing protein-like, partial [Ruditapes philippinarum]|uniref:von Willebrand factor D and EGF domain-containing protein-like n=1 Tax=Ruditapes philippinarum TaxID=129788 RepID=UPI00295C152B